MKFSFKIIFLKKQSCESRKPCIKLTKKCRTQLKLTFQLYPNLYSRGSFKLEQKGAVINNAQNHAFML